MLDISVGIDIKDFFFFYFITALFFKLFEPLIGPASIQFANGEDGRCRRKMYDRAFAHDKFGSYYKSFQKVRSFNFSFLHL